MSAGKPILETFLAHQHSGHNKGYVSQVLELDNGTYLHAVAWGGIGRSFQKKQVQFHSRGRALQAHEKIVSEKLGKGYLPCSPNLLGFVPTISFAAETSPPIRVKTPGSLPPLEPALVEGPRKTRRFGPDDF